MRRPSLLSLPRQAKADKPFWSRPVKQTTQPLISLLLHSSHTPKDPILLPP